MLKWGCFCQQDTHKKITHPIYPLFLPKCTHEDSSWLATWVLYNEVSLWLLQVRVPMRVLWRYHTATGCAIASVTIAAPSKVLLLAAVTVVLCYMRHTHMAGWRNPDVQTWCQWLCVSLFVHLHANCIDCLQAHRHTNTNLKRALTSCLNLGWNEVYINGTKTTLWKHHIATSNPSPISKPLATHHLK